MGNAGKVHEIKPPDSFEEKISLNSRVMKFTKEVVMPVAKVAAPYVLLGVTGMVAPGILPAVKVLVSTASTTKTVYNLGQSIYKWGEGRESRVQMEQDVAVPAVDVLTKKPTEKTTDFIMKNTGLKTDPERPSWTNLIPKITYAAVRIATSNGLSYSIDSFAKEGIKFLNHKLA